MAVVNSSPGRSSPRMGDMAGRYGFLLFLYQPLACQTPVADLYPVVSFPGCSLGYWMGNFCCRVYRLFRHLHEVLYACPRCRGHRATIPFIGSSTGPSILNNPTIRELQCRTPTSFPQVPYLDHEWSVFPNREPGIDIRGPIAADQTLCALASKVPSKTSGGFGCQG